MLVGFFMRCGSLQRDGIQRSGRYVEEGGLGGQSFAEAEEGNVRRVAEKLQRRALCYRLQCSEFGLQTGVDWVIE